MTSIPGRRIGIYPLGTYQRDHRATADAADRRNNDADTARRALDQAIADAVRVARTDAVIPCRLDPERWYPFGPKAAQRAIDDCHLCPVLDQCRTFAHANTERDGVWGGEWYNGTPRPVAFCALDGCLNELPLGRVRYCSPACGREADLRSKREYRRQQRRARRLAGAQR